MFILDVATKSQEDHKLFSATCILCSKKFCNLKIEGSSLNQTNVSLIPKHSVVNKYLYCVTFIMNEIYISKTAISWKASKIQSIEKNLYIEKV